MAHLGGAHDDDPGWMSEIIYLDVLEILFSGMLLL